MAKAQAKRDPLASYGTMITELKLLDAGGANEAGHELQDKLYRKFVSDVASGRLGGARAKLVAKALKRHVSPHYKERWYA